MIVPIIVTMLSGVAGAQEAPVDAHGFVLAAYDADARDLLMVQRPGSFEGGSAFAGALFEYGRRPLVAEDPSSGEEIFLLDDLYALNLSVGVALNNRLRLDATAPAYAFTGFDLTSAETSGLGVGDTRVSAMVSLLRAEEGDGFSIGLVPHLDLPSGQFHNYLGRKRVAGGGVATVSLEDGPITITASGGVQIETEVEIATLPNPDSAVLGAGLGWMLDSTLGLNVEALGKVPVGSDAPGLTATPVELLAHLRYAEAGGGAHFTAGGGVGLTDGLGSSRFRVFVGGGFGSGGGPKDADGDGVVDELDGCPDVAEVRNGFEDEDGCPDSRPMLSAIASVEGVAVSGATLELDGPVQRKFTTGSAPYQLEVDPGSIWKGRATLGECLVGEVVTTIEEGDATVEVPLELKVHGRMRMRLIDGSGEPIIGAAVRFVHKDRYCSPTGEHRTDENGQLSLGMGKGTHQVIIRVDGRQLSEEFTPEEGRETELFVLMSP